MLHEVAAGDLDLTNIVNPVRKLLKNVAFFEGEVQEIDPERRHVVVGHGFDSHSRLIEFDQIVLSLGSTTQFFGLPGVQDHALTMKSLSDAIRLRNRLNEGLRHLQEPPHRQGEASGQPLKASAIP